MDWFFQESTSNGWQTKSPSPSQPTTAPSRLNSHIPSTPRPQLSSVQTWVKLRPPLSIAEAAIRPEEDDKTITFLWNPKELSPNYEFQKAGRPTTLTSDGVLDPTDEAQNFEAVAAEVIDMAMEGKSGVIILLGGEQSGKNYTFYGDFKKFETRGMMSRVFERIFEIVETRSLEWRYVIRLGIVDVRKEKIRDLVSLSPKELKTIGHNGPVEMVLQQILCVEHGLTLILRALKGQMLKQDIVHAKYHTVFYVDIKGNQILPGELTGYTKPGQVCSRITLVKLASIPERAKKLIEVSESPPSVPRGVTPCGENDHSAKAKYKGLPSSGNLYVPKSAPAGDSHDRPLTCCATKEGKLGEAIAIRRDLLFLEELFLGLGELHQHKRYYTKLNDAGMKNVMHEPKIISSQYFRQNKLCACLRSVAHNKNEIRIIAHFRTEYEYLPTAVEVYRLLDHLRAVPLNISVDESQKGKVDDVSVLQDQIEALKEELDRIYKSTWLVGDDGVKFSKEQIDKLIIQATDFANGKIDCMDVKTKVMAKIILDHLRYMYQMLKSKKNSKRTVKSKQPQNSTSILPKEKKATVDQTNTGIKNTSARKFTATISKGGAKAKTEKTLPQEKITEDEQLPVKALEKQELKSTLNRTMTAPCKLQDVDTIDINLGECEHQLQTNEHWKRHFRGIKNTANSQARVMMHYVKDKPDWQKF